VGGGGVGLQTTVVVKVFVVVVEAVAGAAGLKERRPAGVALVGHGACVAVGTNVGTTAKKNQEKKSEWRWWNSRLTA
jgi:hypothetical protein